MCVSACVYVNVSVGGHACFGWTNMVFVRFVHFSVLIAILTGPIHES